MNRSLKDLLTSNDNETFETTRVLGMAVVVVFLCLTVASFITGKPFDMQAFGIGAGAAVGAMGLAIRASDPPPPPPPKEDK